MTATANNETFQLKLSDQSVRHASSDDMCKIWLNDLIANGMFEEGLSLNGPVYITRMLHHTFNREKAWNALQHLVRCQLVVEKAECEYTLTKDEHKRTFLAQLAGFDPMATDADGNMCSMSTYLGETMH